MGGKQQGESQSRKRPRLVRCIIKGRVQGFQDIETVFTKQHGKESQQYTRGRCMHLVKEPSTLSHPWERKKLAMKETKRVKENLKPVHQEIN